MKTASPASGTLQVLLLALLGLFFYVCVFGLLGLLGGMIISRVAHAQASADAVWAPAANLDILRSGRTATLVQDDQIGPSQSSPGNLSAQSLRKERQRGEQ